MDNINDIGRPGPSQIAENMDEDARDRAQDQDKCREKPIRWVGKTGGFDSCLRARPIKMLIDA